ncbi:MAG: hypothetical protein HC824_01720, partial [Synechococcales cyanobacterium RM1_1_8]|nr:hypothetical protein [Synechococcales cyanobacterium RM1_1_8]
GRSRQRWGHALLLLAVLLLGANLGLLTQIFYQHRDRPTSCFWSGDFAGC